MLGLVGFHHEFYHTLEKKKPSEQLFSGRSTWQSKILCFMLPNLRSIRHGNWLCWNHLHCLNLSFKQIIESLYLILHHQPFEKLLIFFISFYLTGNMSRCQIHLFRKIHMEHIDNKYCLQSWEIGDWPSKSRKLKFQIPHFYQTSA